VPDLGQQQRRLLAALLVSTAAALVMPGCAASSFSTARRTGSIAAACARSVSRATCTSPPRSSIASTRPAETMSRPLAGSAIPRNAARRLSAVGASGSGPWDIGLQSSVRW
jgi:hypothetical protein